MFLSLYKTKNSPTYYIKNIFFFKFLEPSKLNFSNTLFTLNFFIYSKFFSFYDFSLITLSVVFSFFSTFYKTQTTSYNLFKLMSSKVTPLAFFFTMSSTITFFNFNFSYSFWKKYSYNNNLLSFFLLDLKNAFSVVNSNSISFVDSLLALNLFAKDSFLLNKNLNYFHLIVLSSNISKLSLILRDNAILLLNGLYDIYAVDYPNRSYRFELSYCFLSIYTKTRFFFKTFVTENYYVESISSIYPSANWLEREVWDFYGIFFANHKNLRRILTDYGFKGFPFRKDFPLTGYVEARFDDSKFAVVYEPLEITQEFRVFNFKSP